MYCETFDENCHGVTLSCQTCCLATHQCLPLHKIKKWNGKFFEHVTLKQLGLIVWLSHEDMFCYCPEHGHLDFVIIDVNGIHPVNVNFCGCEQCVSHCQQLLQCGWYPATIFSAYEYYHTLECLTDNTGINMLKSQYHPFLCMVHQFCHMKLLKRAGRASKQDGIHTTKPGGLTVLCPACPQPGMNLPDDWKDAEPSKKFLYLLIIAIDANFQLKNCACASDQDPGLHTSLAYFVANGLYNEHVLQFPTQEDISTCNSFRSMAHTETKFATGLHTMDQLPKHLCLPLTIIALLFVFRILKFHAPAHSASCAIPHSLNLLPGVGHTDGKGVEHNWSEINCVTNSTKEMTSSARHDTINDHFSHHNFRKLVGLRCLLHDRLKAAIAE
ncbi:hypothetical protein F5J12DRAFT_906920 [Pisolithus orientalis]|uniref:uncharacterized protein n=1 Tax=Pisolithus orientalis TaxID=936130 RepID=UPI0022251BAC|nr:uncharacterized protein F5J12DRAFT_906920 [Pisolithus orientalis]KAI5997833.1 hypothetical protein F5J12DRAFT_906920 [Pisolithus orientalis]